MAATSIHIRPVAHGSEAHNEREKDLPHIREELTPQNESWKDASFPSIDEEMEAIKKDYEAAHGKKLHAKATPIREAVVVIRPDTTIKQLRKACELCQKKWGIRAMQIHIHKDEGHTEEGEWKPNLHAHIVFCWYDFEKHNTCKLGRQAMAQMQTLFAQALGMERGKSSDIEYLTALQYKVAAEEKRLQELQQRTTLETKKIETILAGQEQAVQDLRGQTRELQKIGERAVKDFDWLTRPIFDKAVPAKQKEREYRDRLEAETKKDLAPLADAEIAQEHKLLNELVGKTQDAVIRIGKKLQALARQIPFWKRWQLAHEAELIADKEKAQLEAKNAAEAAKTAIEREKQAAAQKVEEYEGKIRQLDSREERIRKDRSEIAQIYRDLSDIRREEREEGREEGKKEAQEAASGQINSLKSQIARLHTENKDLKGAQQTDWAEIQSLRQEKTELVNLKNNWFDRFQKLAKVLTSVNDASLAWLEKQGVRDLVGSRLWDEAKQERGQEQRQETKPYRGPRR